MRTRHKPEQQTLDLDLEHRALKVHHEQRKRIKGILSLKSFKKNMTEQVSIRYTWDKEENAYNATQEYEYILALYCRLDYFAYSGFSAFFALRCFCCSTCNRAGA